MPLPAGSVITIAEQQVATGFAIVKKHLNSGKKTKSLYHCLITCVTEIILSLDSTIQEYSVFLIILWLY